MRASALIASLLLVAACGDDDSMVLDTGPIPDATTGDAGPDVGSDGSADATADAALDGGGDGSADSAVGDAAADTGVDAGSCGTMPACASDETCWGDGCSCVREIDGESYLRTDGQVFYYRNMPYVVAETAPGTALTGVIEIMDAWRHTCGLRDDGTVWCWTKNTTGNTAGELGDGTIGGATTPGLASQVLTGPGAPLTGIAHLSDRHSSRCYIDRTTCGIRGSDGALFCWGGDNAGGGAGSFFTEGTVGARPYATQIMASDGVPLTNVAEVSLGLRHACAITTSGEVLCWGMNVTGSLGLGDQTHRVYPTAVPLPGGATADEVGAGSDFTCVRSGDRVFCWGSSGGGAVGLGDFMAPENHDGCINYCRTTPAAVIDATDAPLTGAVELEVAYQGACVTMGDHTLRCWGGGVGNVATEPTIGGATLTNVAQLTTCSSNEIATASRYLLRDGTLHYPTREVTLVCP